MGLGIAFSIVDKHTGTKLFESAPTTRNVGVVLCIAWLLIRLIRNVTNNIGAQQKPKGEEVDPTTIDALSKLARLVVFIGAALMMMQTLGLSVSGPVVSVV